MEKYGTELRVFIEQSKKHYAATAGHNTKPTLLARLNKIDQLIGHWHIEQTTRAMLEEFFQSLLENLKLKTVIDYRTLVINVFERAVDEGVIDVNFAKKVKLSRPKSDKPDPFTLAEIKQVTSAPNVCPMMRLTFIVGISTGLRVGELLGLAWEQVDFKNRRMTVYISRFRRGYKYTKNDGSERVIALNNTAMKALQRLFILTGNAPAEPVLLYTDSGQHPVEKQFRFVFRRAGTDKLFNDDRELSKAFKCFLAECGVKHRPPKNLRQTFTSQSLLAGVNKIHVAQDLGHATTEMIDRHYFQYIPADAPDYQRSFDAHIEQAKPRKRKPWYHHKRPIGVLLTRLCMPQPNVEDW